jgi:hypothetical protein
MKRVNAYSFDAPINLWDLRVRLNELGPWNWVERDNDRWGEYISTRALPEGIVKILVDNGLYVVNFVLEAEPEKLDAVYDTLFTYVLPNIGATQLIETDPYE